MNNDALKALERRDYERALALLEGDLATRPEGNYTHWPAWQVSSSSVSTCCAWAQRVRLPCRGTSVRPDPTAHTG